jgi:hypothetical protein
MQIAIEELKHSKVDSKDFLKTKTETEKGLREMTTNYQVQIDRALNTENYIEKYLPLYF